MYTDLQAFHRLNTYEQTYKGTVLWTSYMVASSVCNPGHKHRDKVHEGALAACATHKHKNFWYLGKNWHTCHNVFAVERMAIFSHTFHSSPSAANIHVHGILYCKRNSLELGSHNRSIFDCFHHIHSLLNVLFRCIHIHIPSHTH